MNISSKQSAQSKLYLVIFIILAITAGLTIWQAVGEGNSIDLLEKPFKENTTRDSKTMDNWRCLKDDEDVEYNIKEGGKLDGELYIIIKVNNETKNEIKIKDIRDLDHLVEIHKCGIYIVKLFNYNKQSLTQGLGYRDELWKYDYNGNSQRLILLSEKDNSGDYIAYYSQAFRVSPSEQYVSLIKGYLGRDDYAVVIKDLESKEDVFEVSLNDISKKDPELIGALDLKYWTQDSRYFWARTHMGAETKAFIRIDTDKMKYELLDTPEVLMGGEDLNVETGWTSYHPDAVWTGVHQLTEEIKAERRQAGIGTKLYIYNLFTGEQKFIYQTPEPIFFTAPKWISDTQLEYNTPQGEKQIYNLTQ